jgi:hypothetical protein
MLPLPVGGAIDVGAGVLNCCAIAATVTELESGLADLAMNAMNIRATGLELSGGQAAPAPTPTVAAIAQQFNTPAPTSIATSSPVPPTVKAYQY